MYYFDKPENVAKLEQAIKGWERTPFMLNARVKGKGIDCSNYLAGVLEDSGARNRVLVKPHPDRYFLHTEDNRLLDGVLKLGVEKGDFNKPKDGDIVMYKFGKSISHTGVFLKGYVHHSLFGIGVSSIPWSNKKWKNRMRYVFRLKDKR